MQQVRGTHRDVCVAPQVWKVPSGRPSPTRTLSRRLWYLLASLVCAFGTFATAAIPLGLSTFHLIEAVILLTSIASTFVGFAVEAMMAHLTALADRGRVSGWFQAGNLGRSGERRRPRALAFDLQLPGRMGDRPDLSLLIMLSCAAALPLLPDVPAEPRLAALVGEVRSVVRELWQVLRSREGAQSAVLCFLPVGS